MTKLFYDDDADVRRLAGRRVAVIGYGSQGHAHALNLRDSGVDVVVGLREGSRSRDAASSLGLSVAAVDDAVEQSAIIMILTPDTGQARLYCDSIQPHLRPGKTLMFAPGF
ncbi:MAG TPA: NAD(P)-dependent oxidoreductase, partial [Gemmatimonadaceae bacterium]|nr:NAD(P)-dependent oxidoreductase [Gemmatimonadaceae bacterium]